ncbi:hypothetical protein SH1V18_43880 [Vallitalea longa]|uniref:Uncharacterized protein n=1 Tax=Vallitalea longa TaxID=2936439 RepID=A0A9W6DHX2_9FIRM|nr:hypothetical protein [Vallitalea longa]GKX31908.1 hypothetical protein SH1V18_43880 [Vallitalea longa]
MKTLKKIVILGITILTLTACKSSDDKYVTLYKQLLDKQPPAIEKITFENKSGKILTEDESGLITIYNNTELTATVKGDSTEAEVYFVPSGNDNSEYKQLVTSGKANHDKFIFTLKEEEFSDSLGYLWIVVYNNELGRKSEEFKISLTEE